MPMILGLGLVGVAVAAWLTVKWTPEETTEEGDDGSDELDGDDVNDSGSWWADSVESVRDSLGEAIDSLNEPSGGHESSSHGGAFDDDSSAHHSGADSGGNFDGH
jgi:hypothetical protein